MAIKQQNFLTSFTAKLHRRGIGQSQAFQCFVTGGISGMCGIGTLLLLDSPSQSLAQEIIALMAIANAIVGIGMAITGYIGLLILRFIQTTPGSTIGHHSKKPAHYE